VLSLREQNSLQLLSGRQSPTGNARSVLPRSPPRPIFRVSEGALPERNLAISLSLHWSRSAVGYSSPQSPDRANVQAKDDISSIAIHSMDHGLPSNVIIVGRSSGFTPASAPSWTKILWHVGVLLWHVGKSFSPPNRPSICPRGRPHTTPREGSPRFFTISEPLTRAFRLLDARPGRTRPSPSPMGSPDWMDADRPKLCARAGDGHAQKCPCTPWPMGVDSGILNALKIPHCASAPPLPGISSCRHAAPGVGPQLSQIGQELDVQPSDIEARQMRDRLHITGTEQKPIDPASESSPGLWKQENPRSMKEFLGASPPRPAQRGKSP
jgi:hypothetical protein